MKTSSHTLLAVAAFIFLATGPSVRAQAVWNQTGDPIDNLLWDDIANWDTGVFPNAAGAVANFTDPTGFVDTNAIVRLGQNITIGQLNYQDFVNNGQPEPDNIGQSDLQLNSDFGIMLTMDRGDDTMPAINFVGSYNDGDFIRIGQNNNLILAGDDGLAINTAGLVILDGPNTYSGQTIITGLDSGPDRSGDGRVRVEDVTGLGATGVGNETIIRGSGAPDGFGSNNRLETSLRFGGNEVLAGPIAEDLIFSWTPVPHSDTTFTRRIWDDAIFVEDDHPVHITGTITLQRLPQVDPQNADTRWDFQCGDGGTGNGDDNLEFLQVDMIVLDDQSGGDSNGDFRNAIEFNAVNGPTDPLDPATGSQIVVGSILGATETNRDMGVLISGDGTVRFTDPSDFEGHLRINRGTVIIEDPAGIDDAQHVRLGAGGTNGGNDLDGNMDPIPMDQLRFLLGAPGTYQIQNRGGTPPNGDIQLEDVTGNTADEDDGDEIPYVIGTTATGVVRLEFDDITYNGDGWANNDSKPQLDSLDPQIHFVAPEGSQLTIAGRIEGPNSTDPEGPGNGTVSVTKLGRGTVVLSENPNQPEDHQYNGDTTVSGGALIIDRRVTSDGEVLVEEETTFGGSAAIGSGFANVLLGGSLDPGSRTTDGSDTSTVGELTILGSMDMSGGEALFFDLGAPGTGDRVVVSGALVSGGVLIVRNAGGLAEGTYDLFDAAAHSGALPFISSSSAPGFTYQIVEAASGDIDLQVTAVGGADSDGDGMPDDYEDANGLDKDDPSDAALDNDGDGSDNLAEYVFGTDPNDHDSMFAIGSPVVGDADVSVTFGPVISGVTYVTEASSDLQTWTVIDTLVANADAPSETVATALTGRMQFRVRGSR